MNGQFNESNPCQLCNASQSRDDWTENPGMFTLLIFQFFVKVSISINWVFPQFQFCMFTFWINRTLGERKEIIINPNLDKSIICYPI